MANPDGTPIWYELLADDADAAQAFYAAAIGWSVAPAPTSGASTGDYRILSAPDGAGVGGLMTRPAQAPFPPGWLFYVGVDDVDATAARIVAAGGAVTMPAMDVPTVGRMALVADPHGAPFYIMKGASPDASTAFRQGHAASPGHAVWNELTAPDQDAAMAFYADVFGWRHEGAMSMGALGEYRFIRHGSLALGASMNSMPQGRDGWLFYFHVDDVDAAIARMTGAGGSVLQGPDPIPGGSYSVVASDPAGARFGIVGARA